MPLEKSLDKEFKFATHIVANVAEDATRELYSETATLSNYYVVFHDFAFAIFCCPFRLAKVVQPSKSGGRQVFEAKTYLPQQMICGMFTVLSVLAQVNILIDVMPGVSRKPPVHLEFLRLLFFSLLTCFTIKLWWFNSHLFANVINFASSNVNQLPPVKRSWFTTKMFTGLTCCFYLFATSLEISRNFVRSDHGLSGILLWWQDQVNFGKLMFFMSHKDNVNSKVEILVGVLSFIGALH